MNNQDISDQKENLNDTCILQKKAKKRRFTLIYNLSEIHTENTEAISSEHSHFLNSVTFISDKLGVAVTIVALILRRKSKDSNYTPRSKIPK